VHAALAELSAAVLDEGADAEPLDVRALAAPLPRAYEWVDGSAYLSHIALVRKARGAELPKTLFTEPLVYQGGSGVLLGPRDPLVLPDPEWGLDLEAEVAVVLGAVVSSNYPANRMGALASRFPTCRFGCRGR